MSTTRLLLATTIVFGLVAVACGIIGITRATRAGPLGRILSIAGLLGGLISLPWNVLVLLVTFIMGPHGFSH